MTVATGLSSQGQGHQTILAQIAADELGVPIERIQVTTGDTRRLGWGVGTFASRTAVVSGNAVHKAAVDVRRQAAELAARILEVDPEDLEFVDGAVDVVGSPGRGIQLGQLAAMANPMRYAFGEESAEAALLTRRMYASQEVPLPDGTTPGLNAIEYYSPASGVFGFGMHAAVVEVDAATCDVRILRYVVQHDCGRIINPTIVDGQIYGGIAQGIGGALYERMDYDDAGPAAERELHGLPDALRDRGPGARAAAHRDAVAQQRARDQGRRRGGDDPGRRGDRQRGLGRDRHADRQDADLAVRPVRAPAHVIRIGIDTGGTFTDVVATDPDGRVFTTKVPSTPSDPSVAFLRAIEKASTGEIAEVVHGTTVATNALLEDDFSGLGFITTRGLPRPARDRPPERARSYGNSYFWVKPDRIVPLHLVQEVDERLDVPARVLREFDEAEARAVARWFREQGIDCVGVCFLHSYMNPDARAAHARGARARSTPTARCR